MSAVRNETTSLLQFGVHRSSNVFGCLVHLTKQNAKLNQETAHPYVWWANPQKSRRFVQNVSMLPYRATVFVTRVSFSRLANY